jgi:hypothetical protein
LISPIPGEPSELPENFTALEIQEFERNSERQMRAVLARIQGGDMVKETRNMWKALKDRVERDEIPGAESSGEVENQSGDGLEEKRSREPSDETNGLVVDEYDPSRGIEWAKKVGNGDDGEVSIGSTFF